MSVRWWSAVCMLVHNYFIFVNGELEHSTGILSNSYQFRLMAPTLCWNGSIGSRNPRVLGWFTFALDFGCAFITPLLKVTPPANQQPCKRTVVAGRSTIGCRCQGIVWLQVGELVHAARPQQINFFLSERMRCALRIFFNKLGVFCQRAILIWGLRCGWRY